MAHEDHPQRALHAALAMQEELRRHADRLRTEGKIFIEARVGVNTGEVVVRTIETGGHTEYTPVGHVTNLAARMQTAAPSGSIAASEATQRLCEGYFEFRALGPTAVKGLNDAVEVYEVVRAGPLRSHFQLSARRGLTRFVGREREMEAMAGALEQVRAGHGQVVATVAEAGTGKSRLFHEFKTSLPAECKVLEAYSVSHGKAVAWLPVLELLKSYFGIEEAGDKAQRRVDIERRLSALDPALKDALPLLHTLIGLHEGPDPLAQMDAHIKRRRTLDAIKRIIVRESLNQPTVVIFEDLHWIDNETQALLDLLADSIANSRVLLLVNYRPEYRHDWANKSNYSQFRLEALGRESAGEMFSALLGDEVDLAPLKRLVIERTEGNPFFIEEMVQALFDEGALVRNGAVKVTRPLSQLRLPPTVQGILASRIDRLSVGNKDLLQTLAVIGRESPLGLIRKVAAKEETQLERMLADLRAAEFIYEQPALAEPEYVFKHALTQEVAYNSLLIERRKVLHERVARCLEEVFDRRLDDHVHELAHHYTAAGLTAAAVAYWQRAGQQATDRAADAEAVHDFNKGLELLKTLPDSPERAQQELMLQLKVAIPLQAIRGWGTKEVEQACVRAMELCRQIGDAPQMLFALSNLATLFMTQGKCSEALELGQRALTLAQRQDDLAAIAGAYTLLGHAHFFAGELLAARMHLEDGLAAYDRFQGEAPPLARIMRLLSLGRLAQALCFLGYPDQGVQRMDEALTLVRALNHPFELTRALNLAAGVHYMRGEAQRVRELSEEVISLARQNEFPILLAEGTMLRGWALACLGQFAEGIGQIRQGLLAVAPTVTLVPHYLGLLAETLEIAGQIEDGLAALREARAVVRRVGQSLAEGTLDVREGKLIYRRSVPPDRGLESEEQAARCFRTAIEICRRQGAKGWELRATVGLARLLAKQGRRDEARAMLAEIYNWFTEGFDTADLKDAKTLLEELSA